MTTDWKEAELEGREPASRWHWGEDKGQDR